MSETYCPKCGCKLYPDDAQYLRATGVCSYCVTFDSTPDQRFRRMYAEVFATAVVAPKKPRPVHWSKADPELRRRAASAVHDTWSAIAQDTPNAELMPLSTMVELVLDASHLESFGDDAEAVAWIHTLSRTGRMDFVRSVLR